MTTYQEIHGIRYKMYATCIDAEAPNYKACISACHVGSKQLITYQDVLEKGGNLSDSKAKCKGAVTIQRTAPTMEQALDYAEQDIPRLTEIIAPVIRTSSTSTATFGAEFERLIPAIFPPDTKNGRNQTSYLRRHIKPILQEYRMDEIDNALVLDTVKKLLAEETKEKYRIEVRNRHLESIRKFLKECKPYLPHVKNIDYELEGLRSISKSRAKTTNALQGHFSNEERTALLRWCVENLESQGFMVPPELPAVSGHAYAPVLCRATAHCEADSPLTLSPAETDGELRIIIRGAPRHTNCAGIHLRHPAAPHAHVVAGWQREIMVSAMGLSPVHSLVDFYFADFFVQQSACVEMAPIRPNGCRLFRTTQKWRTRQTCPPLIF